MLALSRRIGYTIPGYFLSILFCIKEPNHEVHPVYRGDRRIGASFAYTPWRSGGYMVFAAGTNEEKLRALGETPGIIPVRMDVTSPESVQSARDTVATRTDRLDAVVNFAGLAAFASMIEGDPIPLTEKVLAVNVLGAARVNWAFFDLVQTGHGRIVNCSSEAGWMTAQPFAAPYYLSKRAMEAYNDSLRRELMFLGIPVVKIQPGSYQTHLTGVVSGGFERTLAQTEHYREVLSKMRPMMDMELLQKNDPQKLVRTVIRGAGGEAGRASVTAWARED